MSLGMLSRVTAKEPPVAEPRDEMVRQMAGEMGTDMMNILVNSW